MEGNFTRDLWKISCWEMAKDVCYVVKTWTYLIVYFPPFTQPGYSAHEKAIYAALSGNIKQVHISLLGLCKSTL